MPIRYEESYDLADEDYEAWLKLIIILGFQSR